MFLWQSTLCHKCCQLSLRLNWTQNFPLTSYHFDTNLKYWGENGSLYPLKGETERERENHPAFPLYVSQQCSTEFLPKVWTHKTAPVPLWKLWHQDWDRSVTSTSIWPVQQILDHFLINMGSESTRQFKQHESHSVNSTQALTGQQIYGECFPYIIIDHIFTSPGIDCESG